MKFIRTDRGDYVSAAAIERIEKEVPDKISGRPDNGIRVFKFYNNADDLLGSIKVREERMDFLLAELIPSQPGEKLISLHFDREAREVWHQEHRIIAWAFRPWSDSPEPVTPAGVIDEAGVKLLFERPDGKLDDMWDRDYDSLETAKAEFLKRNLAEAAE